MRHRVLAIAVVILGMSCARAEAVTVNDLVALSKEGVSDEILVALIEADHTVFNLDGSLILMLKDGGVSDRVVLKMLRSGRESAPPPLAAPPQPPPVIVVQQAPETRIVEVPVPIVQPVYVPIAVSVSHRHEASRRVAADGVPVERFRGDFGRFMVVAPAQPRTFPVARQIPAPMRTLPPARQTPPSIR